MTMIGKTVDVIRSYTEKVTVYICDDCGAETNKPKKCGKCFKDLCPKCVADHDFQGYYCNDCWEIMKPYTVKINKLGHERSRLETECRNKCMAKRQDDKLKACHNDVIIGNS